MSALQPSEAQMGQVCERPSSSSYSGGGPARLAFLSASSSSSTEHWARREEAQSTRRARNSGKTNFIFVLFCFLIVKWSGERVCVYVTGVVEVFVYSKVRTRGIL